MDVPSQPARTNEPAPPRNTCTACNVCSTGASFDEAEDVARIRCNVRRFRHETFTVWRCRSCRSLHSLEAVNLDDYYADYFVAQQRLDYFTRCAFHRRLRWLRDVGLHRNHRILEYGCGAGLFVDYLRLRGFHRISGFDRYVAEFADDSWRRESFDVITSYDVVEHAEDPLAMLAEQVAALRPGGLLVVGTPNAEKTELTATDLHVLHQPFHRHILSERALTAICEQFGLQIVEVRNGIWMDTPWPFVNWTFVKHYVRRLGDVADVLAEPPRLGAVLTSPRLLFYGLAGCLFPSREHMMVVARRPRRHS